MTYVFRTKGENLRALVVKGDGDAIKKPSHYQGRHGMEAIDVVKNFSACPEHEEGFYWGNAVKYLLRYHARSIRAAGIDRN
ncbi:DUF3310 domain-containing protein [Streptococcus halichoeri]|uniref:DUF3310 domain-containing protein n=1 Tax=Streptococcus halichoeri TaxID=254785 RepID=UPI001F1F6CCA|nr:DUF3310 domain-containing protein [Streptococcus halichoeri]